MLRNFVKLYFFFQKTFYYIFLNFLKIIVSDEPGIWNSGVLKVPWSNVVVEHKLNFFYYFQYINTFFFKTSTHFSISLDIQLTDIITRFSFYKMNFESVTWYPKWWSEESLTRLTLNITSFPIKEFNFSLTVSRISSEATYSFAEASRSLSAWAPATNKLRVGEFWGKSLVEEYSSMSRVKWKMICRSVLQVGQLILRCEYSLISQHIEHTMLNDCFQYFDLTEIWCT